MNSLRKPCLLVLCQVGLLMLGPSGRASSDAAAPARAAASERMATTTVEAGLHVVVEDALAANLELQAGSATVRQRLAVLEQARARYLPTLDFAARYTLADGGRSIEFPVGDLLNPIYATLDEMLVASGQPAQFPRVRNQHIDFLRSHEQETRFILEQPLYEPRLRPAVDASRAQLDGAESNLAALRSRVVRDARQGYYQWLAAQQATRVLDASRELAAANLAANQSLYRNGKITRDLVYRAEADVLEIEQQRLNAASRVRLAQAYVNLLRNAPHDRPLPEASVDADTVARFRGRLIERIAGRQVDAALLQDLAMDRRQELKSLDAAVEQGVAQQALARAAFRPRLALGAEAGIQGTSYGFGSDERYVLASVILRWNLFHGGADRAELAQAVAFTEELRASRELAGQRVRLEVQQATENLEVADASLETAAKRAQAAESGFRIVARKRDLGQINQAEYIDARRTLTDAQLNLTRIRTEFLARLAELEYAIGAPAQGNVESPS
jgi:outer membrane protein TolC